jgi:TonB family protein
MMRNAIVAALVLSPLMVHAQANMPAQPKATVLQASLTASKGFMLAAAAAGAEDRATVKTGSVRISTGVVAPKLIHKTNIQTAVPVGALDTEHDVTVAMVVDEKGKPSDLKIVQSAGVALDQDVLSAVKDYRFEPGSVSGMVVAVPLVLHITIK